MTRKGALTLISVVLVLIAAGLGGYYYFFMRTPATPSGDETTNNPFGTSTSSSNNPGNPEGNGTATGQGETATENTYIAKLRQISQEPIAGVYLFDRLVQVGTSTKNKITKSYIRFVERATGHINEIATDSNTTQKISNTTIPKIYEALWGGEGSVILRYLKDNDAIQTYSATIPRSTSTEPVALDGVFLADNITDIHFSPKGDKIFYLTPTGQGIVAKPNGQSSANVYSSPTNEWLSDWAQDNLVTLTTKPSATIPGYSYLLNLKTGSAAKVLTEINGLTTKTSPSGAYILYSDSGRGLRTTIFDTKKQISNALIVPTLSDKCVWNVAGTAAYCAVPSTLPNASYPDAWYQGRIHFSDNIYKIAPDSGIATKIFDPTASNRASIDAINLMVNAKEDTLIFTNKNDATLWSLDLSQ